MSFAPSGTHTAQAWVSAPKDVFGKEDRVGKKLVQKAIDKVKDEDALATQVYPVRMGIIRGRIEQVLDWAKTHELRKGENPARWRGHLENLLPDRNKVATVTHRAAMPYAEVGASRAGAPGGYTADRSRVQRGQGVAAFELAIEATRQWEDVQHALA